MRTQETIRTLNRLIQTCRDSEELCRTLSDAAETQPLASALRSRSEEWARQGDELQALVLHLDGEPETGGTPSAWLLRARMIAKAALLGPRDMPTIEAWERMHQQAAHRYEEALSSYLPARIRRTVSLQADRVDDRSGQMGRLRGRYALHTHGV